MKYEKVNLLLKYRKKNNLTIKHNNLIESLLSIVKKNQFTPSTKPV